MGHNRRNARTNSFAGLNGFNAIALDDLREPNNAIPVGPDRSRLDRDHRGLAGSDTEIGQLGLKVAQALEQGRAGGARLDSGYDIGDRLLDLAVPVIAGLYL